MSFKLIKNNKSFFVYYINVNINENKLNELDEYNKK